VNEEFVNDQLTDLMRRFKDNFSRLTRLESGKVKRILIKP
jgi:hypothetical protein